MSTAVEPNDIDPVPQKHAEEEEPKEVMPFKWYLTAEPCFEIL